MSKPAISATSATSTTATPTITLAPTLTANADTASESEPAVQAGERLAKHPPRIPSSADEPTTLVEMIERAVAKYRKPDALNFKRDGAWQRISSDEMLRRMRHIALGLHSLGIGRGDRIAILSENRPEWTLTDGGALLLGAIDVPIYATQTPAQVCYILNDSGARVLFAQDRKAYERVAANVRDCSHLERIVFFDEREIGDINQADSTKTRELMGLSALEEKGRALANAEPTLATELASRVRPDDLATIIYTSGTTGDPKGVMLTHSNFVSNFVDCADHLSFNKDDIALSVLPLSHVFERTGMYIYIHHGMSVYFNESLDRIAANMQEVRPTIMLVVPRLIEKIYARIQEKAAQGGKVKASLLQWAVDVGKRWSQLTLRHESVPLSLRLQHKIASRLVFSKWHAATGGRLRLFLAGGAALPEELGYIFDGAGLPTLQGYGLTETSPVISASKLEANRPGTVGHPIKNVEVRIAEDGEIEVRGPNVMQGYFNKPEETRKVFTEDGWFKTGDIGELDADGYLKITDRKKELFKTSGGKYIAPTPIEARIKASRFVSQVVLIGDGRKFPAALIVPNWELLRAYAKLKNIEISTPAEFCQNPRILDLMQRQVDSLTGDLAQYERVKRIALLERELTTEGGELTPTLKVKRRVVNEKYRQVIDKLYEETA